MVLVGEGQVEGFGMFLIIIIKSFDKVKSTKWRKYFENAIPCDCLYY